MTIRSYRANRADELIIILINIKMIGHTNSNVINWTTFHYKNKIMNTIFYLPSFFYTCSNTSPRCKFYCMSYCMSYFYLDL